MRYEANLQDHEPVVVFGARGMQSKPFTKRFRSLVAALRWIDSEASANSTIYEVARS